jgi:hypothetical protein
LITTSYEIRANRINTPDLIDGHRRLIVTVRDKDKVRQEQSKWGPLQIECGGELRLESLGQREVMAQEFDYSAAPEDLDQPGGQDAGVWVWDIPEGATGRIAIEADWLRQMTGGYVELIAMD